MEDFDNYYDLIHSFMHQYKNNSQNISAVQAVIREMNDPNDTQVTKPFYTFHKSRHVLGSVVLITAYSILMLISLFGNSIICYVILRNKKMYTVTNFFIANMALSDLFVTLFNVPFNVARFLLDEWPFGHFFCHLMNYSLMVSVYVSTFTLSAIALDRQYILLYPLRPRMTKRTGLILISMIWIVSILLSLPFGMYTKVIDVDFFVYSVKRCQPSFPKPRAVFKKWLTLTSIILQYFIPLTIIAVCYGRIVRKLWRRSNLGAITQSQQLLQSKAKKRSIKLLVTVIIIFALCWLPLTLYHILTTFHPDATVFKYNSTAFFVLHWIAISSICYNPFVYCWMNETFRAVVKSYFCFCFRFGRRNSKSDMDGLLHRCDILSRYRQKTFSTFLRSSSNFSSVRLSRKNTADSYQISGDNIPLCETSNTTLENISNTSSRSSRS